MKTKLFTLLLLLFTFIACSPDDPSRPTGETVNTLPTNFSVGITIPLRLRQYTNDLVPVDNTIGQNITFGVQAMLKVKNYQTGEEYIIERNYVNSRTVFFENSHTIHPGNIRVFLDELLSANHRIVDVTVSQMSLFTQYQGRDFRKDFDFNKSKVIP